MLIGEKERRLRRSCAEAAERLLARERSRIREHFGLVSQAVHPPSLTAATAADC